jgi:hypothetical protein
MQPLMHLLGGAPWCRGLVTPRQPDDETVMMAPAQGTGEPPGPVPATVVPAGQSEIAWNYRERRFPGVTRGPHGAGSLQRYAR